MIPSLFTFTILISLVFLAIGITTLLKPEKVIPLLKAFPRNRQAAIVTMVIGGGWFLWKITQLGKSDFGDYKNLLLILFGATLIGSILYVKDFLAVRGVSIIVLLSANTGLKAAFGLYDIPERLFLVSLLYVLIIAALIYGIMPYHMRESVNWLTAEERRVRNGGYLTTAIGAILLLCAFLY